MTKDVRIRRLIAKNFPSFVIDSLVLPNQGQDHLAAIVNGEYVFRFPRKALYKKTFRNEVGLMEWMHKHLPLEVPHYTLLNKDRFCGAYKIIAGKPLKPAVLESWSREEKTRAAKDIAAFLKALHALPADVADKKFNLPKASLGKWIPVWKRTYKQFAEPLLNAEERKTSERMLSAFSEPMFKNTPKTLIHYDLYCEHIIADPERHRITGIIDFSDSAIGDPAADIAKSWEYGKDFVLEVRKHYGPVSADPDMLKRSLAYYQRAQIAWVRYAAKGLENMDEALPALKESLKMTVAE